MLAALKLFHSVRKETHRFALPQPGEQTLELDVKMRNGDLVVGHRL